MKKKYIIIIGLIFLVIFIVVSFLRPKPTPSPIIPVSTPSATTQPIIEITPTETFQPPNDQLYGQAIKDIVNQYPWYPKIPIETQEYRIIFDFDKKSFRIRFLTPLSEQIKQAAIKKLVEIGVDLDKFTYYFVE